MPGCSFTACVHVYMCVHVQALTSPAGCGNQGELVDVFTLWPCFIHVNEDKGSHPSKVRLTVEVL